jgi:hypothetical protein
MHFEVKNQTDYGETSLTLGIDGPWATNSKLYQLKFDIVCSLLSGTKKSSFMQMFFMTEDEFAEYVKKVCKGEKACSTKSLLCGEMSVEHAKVPRDSSSYNLAFTFDSLVGILSRPISFSFFVAPTEIIDLKETLLAHCPHDVQDAIRTETQTFQGLREFSDCLAPME